jgi:hypothetical protein
MTQVFRETRNPVAYIRIEEGTYLRDQPGGGVQQALSTGTPIMNIQEIRQDKGRTWVQVEVLDGSVGWVVQEWLSAEMPTGEKAD